MSVRQHGDEVYRVTQQQNRRWLWCDRYGNDGGDNIDLVQEIEPGTGFAEAVYRLAGAPTVRQQPAPTVRAPRQPPVLPAQTPTDVHCGREYLVGRGISIETIEQAEKAGMLRYAAGGVLFIGRDEAGAVQNATRRAIAPADPVQKRDLLGSDKRHPPMLKNGSDAVLIVEGGVDALAALDMARRERRPAPTVLVSGGANVRTWIQTPWVQKILQAARRVIVAHDREKSPEVQQRTDAAHARQMGDLRQVCADVRAWTPAAGCKDLADMNLQAVMRESEHEQWQEMGGRG